MFTISLQIIRSRDYVLCLKLYNNQHNNQGATVTHMLNDNELYGY